MRRIVLLALAALGLAGCGGGGDAPRAASGAAAARSAAPSPPAPRWPEPEGYNLDLAYDADRFRLTGTQQIALRNSGPETLDRVWLRTWGNAFGGCARRYVRVDVMSGGIGGRPRVRCTALPVRLDQPLAPGQRTVLELEVSITAPEEPDRFGRFAGAAYFGNAIPVLAVADRSGWALPPYTFRGESFYSLSTSWAVRLALPPGVRAATTGNEMAPSGDTLRVFTQVARDFMIVAGPLTETTRRTRGVTLRHWRVTESAEDADRALEAAGRALARFSRWFGPYLPTELDVVEGPRRLARGAGIGMEYPELVLSWASPRVIDHEVAHQWWYGIVGNDQHAEPWLDESFATYAGLRLAGAKACRPRVRGPPVTAPMSVFELRPQRVYGAVVYDQGACALSRLARAFGRARFDRLLRSVVSGHRDGVLTTRAFLAAVDAAAPAGLDARALLRRQGVRPFRPARRAGRPR